MEGVTSQWLLDKIENPNKKLVHKNELIGLLKASDAPIIVTVGAGDVGEMVPEIKKALDA
jgi:UDP-N-acetylmuramate--alanine ligase